MEFMSVVYCMFLFCFSDVLCRLRQHGKSPFEWSAADHTGSPSTSIPGSKYSSNFIYELRFSSSQMLTQYPNNHLVYNFTRRNQLKLPENLLFCAIAVKTDCYFLWKYGLQRARSDATRCFPTLLWCSMASILNHSRNLSICFVADILCGFNLCLCIQGIWVYTLSYQTVGDQVFERGLEQRSNS